MSNGDGKSRRECEVEYNNNVLSRPKGDEFGRAVAKLALAQICESVGFEGFKDSALDTLTDVTIRFLCDLGKSALFSANLAGRTECNVFDIIRGLEDLRACEGFSGASGVGSCVAGSGIVREVVEYVEMAEEVPFCQPVPSFPVVRSRKLIPSFERMSETPPGKHIPNWLPAFPDRHTYVHTPMWNERKSDPQADKMEQARQRRKAERSLFNLHQRLALCNGSAGPSAPAPVVVEEKELPAEAENNLYLVKPLPYGEKEVSTVELPSKLLDDEDKNHPSVLDAFAPAIEALQSKQLENGESEESRLPEMRPAVCFKLKAGKKYVCESLDLSLQKKGDGRTAPWFGREDERDEKKRRAEYILRQSMENPTELTQL